MIDWMYVPQMLWSVYAMIECVRRGGVGPIGFLVYLLIFTFLLFGTRAYCRHAEEREAKEARRQREREERLAALPPWPWGSK